MQRTATEEHTILDITPLLATAHKDYGTLPLYTSQLRSSSNYIQAMLKNIQKYKRNTVLKKSAICTATTLVLAGFYYGWIWGVIKWSDLKDPRPLHRYSDMHVNGTVTCGDLFPVKEDISTYNLQNFALACADIIYRYYIYGSDIEIQKFVDASCYDYLPKINFNSLTGASAAIVECMSNIVGNADMNYVSYLKTTVTLNGSIKFCNKLLHFANSDEFTSFVSGPSISCGIFAATTAQIARNLNDAFLSDPLRSCNASFPMQINITRGLNTLNDAVPYLGDCFEKVFHETQKVKIMWTARVGEMVAGIILEMALLVLTLGLAYLLYKHIRNFIFSDFSNLPEAQQQDINQLITRFDDSSTPIANDKPLSEVQQQVKQLKIINDDSLDKATAFLEATSQSGLEFFTANDQNLDVRLNILSEARLLR